MRINRRLLAVRMIDLDVNANQLAAISNLSRGTVTSVKSGKSCSAETVKKLANALGVPVDELLEVRL